MTPVDEKTCLCGKPIAEHPCPREQTAPEKIIERVMEIVDRMTLHGTSAVRIFGKQICDEITRGGHLP